MNESQVVLTESYIKAKIEKIYILYILVFNIRFV